MIVHGVLLMIFTQKNSHIIPVQRRSQIIELIRLKGFVSVQELSENVGVSLPTIRRDLACITKSGIIQRSHGGATLTSIPGTTFESDYQTASQIARKEKAAIGKLAADRLKDHQSVIFDSSSTVYEAACRVVENGLILTAVTNDLRIAKLFAGSPSIHLMVCGGSLRRGSYSLLGEPGTSFLRNLHVDVALMGIHAITDTSYCDTSLDVAYTKRYMSAAAQKVIILADASKFGAVAFFDAFSVEKSSEIITDRLPDPAISRALAQKGVSITLAGG